MSKIIQKNHLAGVLYIYKKSYKIMDTHRYQKEELTVLWKPELCAHSTRCWKELGTVFNPQARPWINMDGAGKEAIKEQVGKCPSGALSMEEAEKPATIRVEPVMAPDTLIECRPNGPLLVHGKVIVRDAAGNEEIKEGKFSLCRCGASERKPYCDGNHRKIGFEAS